MDHSGKISLGIGILIVLLLAVLFYEKQETKEVAEKIQIVSTFYPLSEFAVQVGGDLVSVKTVVPSGVEPHEYEPTGQDIVSAYGADIFLVNGAGLDPWAEKIVPELKKRGVTVLMLSENVPLIQIMNEAEKATMDDPHFWLDPVIAEKEVGLIRDTLIAKDPKHRAEYEMNAESYIAELQSLNRDYSGKLSRCDIRTIITTHQAFSYVAKRYDFSAIGIVGISPESEPSPRRLAELSDIVKKEGIRYIFFEALASPKVAITLAEETGVQTLVFNPLEGLTEEERARGEDYISIMRQKFG